MSDNYKYKISVITAVYNAESCISNLIDSLRQQEDQDFEWVVVDGVSTDRTLEILNNVKDLNIQIISEPDFGVYDALNKGINICSGEYYLVAGADDFFFKNAIGDYKKEIEDKYDIFTANVIMGNITIKPSNIPNWLATDKNYISNHALGALIKKDLHEVYGYYSNKFPIVADQYFIQLCALNGVRCKRIDKIVGEFSLQGLSGLDRIGVLTELFRIQLLIGKNKWIHFFIYIYRLIKQLKKQK